ncbi:hypothetical protein [Marinobacter sp. MIT932201]|uniref:hypothetical protein n=1 Tax=Marinobacter sp. MIT932201 TaxID=3096995 RepID=UPI00399B673D
MATEQVTRQDFEEALREDEIQQPKPEPTGAQVFTQVEAELNKYLGSSAADCASTLDCAVANHPETTLADIIHCLMVMNHKRIEKKAHRAAMLKAARKALTIIGEFPHGTENRN